MKKLLIIQLDGAYFLEETFRVLEKFQTSFKDFELTILVAPATLKELSTRMAPLVNGITTEVSSVLTQNFDLSFNLSMEESSWELHGKVQSAHKVGYHIHQGQLKVPDLWSTFLLTVKANAPFLTFHLQDVYRNILGIKKLPCAQPKVVTLKDLVIGNFNETFFSLDERELFIRELREVFPQLTVRNILEVDLISDLTHTLYIGPAGLEALRLGEAGATCLYLGRNFQGFNLLPHAGQHYLATTRGAVLKVKQLIPMVTGMLTTGKPNLITSCSIYRIEHENLYGAYLQSLNQSDDAYPFYQSHVVLWNFLLNLFDVNLDIIKCSEAQIQLMRENQQVLSKLLRLHDYAMSSVDVIYQESKSTNTKVEKVEGHLKNLREIDEVVGKISHSHPMLRPFLDYYRIRRGQNEGNDLVQQIQHTFLTYSEEHHALTALGELFSVTLRKNEASI